jgi:eukaryotic-like serine/threonine-protein kinase
MTKAPPQCGALFLLFTTPDATDVVRAHRSALLPEKQQSPYVDELEGQQYADMSAELRERLQATLGSAYTIERELGGGGMSRVFAATETALGRKVVVKVLPPELAEGVSVERFKREIQLAARLQHPHIVPVLSAGEMSGLPYFMMPLVNGDSLRARLASGKGLPIPEVISILRDVAKALACAHESGVAHRDIKPENVLLTGGSAVVTDFGVAKALSASKTLAAGETLTLVGTSLGTPAYMAPEQVAADPGTDHRADIYAFGVMGYEMLAGRPPFHGRTPQKLLAAQMGERPESVEALRPDTPPLLAELVMKCVEKEPDDRPQSATALVLALEQVTSGGGSPAMPAILLGGRRRIWPALISDGATRSSGEPIRSPTRRFSTTALALLCGLLVAGGMLFVWKTKTENVTPTDTSSVRLAVLPFENVGDTSDAYFADGMTEAVRGKLASLRGIDVIGSASSGQYRKTTKSPQEIGRELRARYLLTGRVRWAKGPGGANRVQVSPELVETSTASEKWAQPFDAPLTNVFQVQADIASRVASELQIALTPAVKRTLSVEPTTNLAAYDAYLRGKEFRRLGERLSTLHLAAAEYEKAIAIDSTFSLAWSSLSDVLALQFGNGMASSALGDSVDRVSEHALRLGPSLAEASAARATYLTMVRNDPAGALLQLQRALAREPGNPRLMRGLAFAEQRMGRWNEAIVHFQQATRLDPLADNGFQLLGDAELSTHHYSEARAALNRALELQPDNLVHIEDCSVLALALGDLAAARAVARKVPSSVDRTALVAYFGTSGDLGWVLDSSDEQLLLTLKADAFDGDEANRSMVLAQQYRFRGELARSRAFADTVLVALEVHLRAAPSDPLLHAQRGLMLAYLNRNTEAVREGKRSLSLPLTPGGTDTPYLQHQMARIYIEVGEPEKALDILAALLRAPYYLSPAWLRIDPNFKALHGNPRFERMIGGA